jgi:DnaJ-class molecular chaperone
MKYDEAGSHVYVKCSQCNGTGVRDEYISCKGCLGNGKRLVTWVKYIFLSRDHHGDKVL